MGQRVYWHQDEPGNPVEAVVRCFDDRDDLSSDSFKIAALPAPDRPFIVWLWHCQQTRELGLMTRELLDEGDPDDQPVPTTNGIVAGDEGLVNWVVVMLTAGETTADGIREALEQIDWVVRETAAH